MFSVYRSCAFLRLLAMAASTTALTMRVTSLRFATSSSNVGQGNACTLPSFPSSCQSSSLMNGANGASRLMTASTASRMTPVSTSPTEYW